MLLSAEMLTRLEGIFLLRTRSGYIWQASWEQRKTESVSQGHRLPVQTAASVTVTALLVLIESFIDLRITCANLAALASCFDVGNSRTSHYTHRLPIFLNPSDAITIPFLAGGISRGTRLRYGVGVNVYFPVLPLTGKWPDLLIKPSVFDFQVT